MRIHIVYVHTDKYTRMYNYCCILITLSALVLCLYLLRPPCPLLISSLIQHTATPFPIKISFNSLSDGWPCECEPHHMGLLYMCLIRRIGYKALTVHYEDKKDDTYSHILTYMHFSSVHNNSTGLYQWGFLSPR